MCFRILETRRKREVAYIRHVPVSTAIEMGLIYDTIQYNTIQTVMTLPKEGAFQ